MKWPFILTIAATLLLLPNAVAILNDQANSTENQLQATMCSTRHRVGSKYLHLMQFEKWYKFNRTLFGDLNDIALLLHACTLNIIESLR